MIDAAHIAVSAQVVPRSRLIGVNDSAGSNARHHSGALLTGRRLQITADVDRAGLKRLQEILARYDGILELVDPETLKN
jgi:hypothetical protein